MKNLKTFENHSDSNNTFILTIANKNGNVKNVLVKTGTLEDAIVKSKSLVFPPKITEGKSIEEIHNLFQDLGFSLKSNIMITGSDYDVKIID